MAGPLRIGVIGVGQRGLQHVEALAQLQREEVVRLTPRWPTRSLRI